MTSNLYLYHNMNPLDLFNQVKEMIEKVDLQKNFVDDINKDNLR